MESREDIVRFVICFYGCLALAAPVIMTAAAREARRRSELLNQALASDDLRSIGALVDTLDSGSYRVQRQCKEALIRLLPRLSEEHEHLLDEYRQARLVYFVMPPASPIYSTRLAQISRNSASSVALRIAIVQALSRIGNHESLTMFDELLERRCSCAADRRVQQAVVDSRPMLAARVMSEPARCSLLRPSDNLDEETLLRIPKVERTRSREELLHILTNKDTSMKAADPEQVVLFDGACNLCNSSVQFIIRNDPTGHFKFCSLQSISAARLLQGRDVDTSCRDTVILLQDGKVYVRSTAVLKVARHLRTPWNLFAVLLIIPRPIRDLAYRMIAANRHKLWKKRAACMAPTPEMRARFLDSGDQPQTGIISGASV